MVRAAFKKDPPAETPARPYRTRDQILPVWFRYTKLGWTCRMIAEELGMRPRSLERSITRARKAGDPRAIYREGYGKRDTVR